MCCYNVAVREPRGVCKSLCPFVQPSVMYSSPVIHRIRDQIIFLAAWIMRWGHDGMFRGVYEGFWSCIDFPAGLEEACFWRIQLEKGSFWSHDTNLSFIFLFLFFFSLSTVFGTIQVSWNTPALHVFRCCPWLQHTWFKWLRLIMCRLFESGALEPGGTCDNMRGGRPPAKGIKNTD